VPPGISAVRVYTSTSPNNTQAQKDKMKKATTGTPGTKIISKVASPNVMIARDGELLQPSANQLSPTLARPNDFRINPSGNEPEVPLHNQHGRTRSQYRRLLKQAGDKLGRSTPVDGLGE
jgi:hypothetical protein